MMNIPHTATAVKVALRVLREANFFLIADLLMSLSLIEREKIALIEGID